MNSYLQTISHINFSTARHNCTKANESACRNENMKYKKTEQIVTFTMLEQKEKRKGKEKG